MPLLRAQPDRARRRRCRRWPHLRSRSHLLRPRRRRPPRRQASSHLPPDPRRPAPEPQQAGSGAGRRVPVSARGPGGRPPSGAHACPQAAPRSARVPYAPFCPDRRYPRGAAVEGVTLLEDEVRELIRRRGVDPLRDPVSLRALVREAVADYDERSLRGHVPPLLDPEAATKAVVDAVAGLGPLQQYLDDETVEEIWINSPTGGIRAGESVMGSPQSAQSPHEPPRTVPRLPCGSGPQRWATSGS